MTSLKGRYLRNMTHIGVLCYITPTPSANNCKKYWKPFLHTCSTIIDGYDTWQVRTVTKEPETESWKYGNTSNPYLTVTFCKIIITHWAFELTLFIIIFFQAKTKVMEFALFQAICMDMLHYVVTKKQKHVDYPLCNAGSIVSINLYLEQYYWLYAIYIFCWNHLYDLY